MAKDLTQGSATRALITFCIPLVISGLLQQLYGWADAFIVGNVIGEGALAATGSASVVINLFITVVTGFTAGLSILSAQRFGSRREGDQKKILGAFSAILGALFLIFSLSGLALTDAFLRLLRSPEDIFDQASVYLKIMMLGLPFMAVYNVYCAVLRGIGDSSAPFWSVLISSIVNVILDILFVASFGWGVEGAALATVISQAFMAVFTVLYSCKRYDALRFRFSRSLFDPDILKNGFRLAAPITIQSAISSAGGLALQNFMNTFGTQTVAAITSAYRVDSIILLPITNLGTGISTITAQNVGAGETERARKNMRAGMALMTVVSLAMTILVLILGGQLIAMFGVTPEATRIGAQFFVCIGSFYTIFGWSMALRGFIEGVGDVTFSGICGIAALAIRIALSYLLRGVHGTMVIAFAEGYSWCFLLAAFALRYFRIRHKSFTL